MKFLRSELAFFLLLFLLILVLFHTAFGIGFFQDDYFFVHISRADTLGQFLNFFNPIRTYSFKPLASEVFYFLLRLFQFNTFLGHVVVFFVYFAGLYFLFESVKSVFKDSRLARLTVILYAVHFSHVFQLYWFATFQEVVVFTALSGSFLLYLRKRYIPSLVFFTAALLSKETATLYAPFLILYEIVRGRLLWPKKQVKILFVYVCLAGIFYLIFSYSLQYVTSLDNYKFQISNLKLFFNNAMWHFLWSLGVPNFMPDVMRSVFSPPLPEFQKYLKQPDFQLYLVTYLPYLGVLALYLLALLTVLKKKILNLIPLTLFCLTSFFLFLGPILFFPHKWMVRLMTPHIFVSLLLAYLLYEGIKKNEILKWVAYAVILFYIVSSFFGIKLHESSSVYLLENRFFTNVSNYMKTYKNTIIKKEGIYFVDNKKKIQEIYWGQSKKLKSSLWDQFFLSYYFPGKQMKAYYNFETKEIPKNVYVIQSEILLR